jgi:2-oxoglutarate ferredoxin oxidoreductase subunit alpha
MVYGAAATGRRAMTTSSSPGFSLMMEGISYLAGSELPCVLVNIQRGGPGLGNISPEQADYFQAVKGGGHGSYRLIVLAPESVQEMADFTFDAFDLADKYRNPVIILADGNLGQMMEPVAFKELSGKPVDKSGWALTGKKNREGHLINSLEIDPLDLQERIEKLYVKYDEMERTEVRYEEYLTEDADVILVAYGIVSRVTRNAINILREEGIKAGMVRPITLWPFPTEIIRKRCETAKRFISVELSRGQMIEDVRLAVEGRRPVGLVNRVGGIVPSPEEVAEKVKSQIQEDK